MPLTRIRLLFFLGLFSINASGLQTPSHPMPNGLTKVGIAIELAGTRREVDDLIQPADNKGILTVQQYLDMALFIPGYLLFFVALGVYGLHCPGWIRRTGWIIIPLAVAGAGCDYFEDFYILRALAGANPPLMAFWGYAKWALLFMMLIATVPIFFGRWKAASLRILGVPFGLYAFFSGAAGLMACLLRHGGRIESASSGLAAPALFFTFLVAPFHDGIIPGLTRIANWLDRWPFTRWIVRWPEFKAPAPGRSPAAAIADPLGSH
jgi:hypothetical protein